LHTFALPLSLQRESRENVIVEFCDELGAWQFIRIAHLNLPETDTPADLGVYACCPTEGACGERPVPFLTF
jgi:regulation of enolase protein 1 (concanavalin A-like superfamily)